MEARGDVAERLREVEIRRRREHRVAAQNDERVHFARIHVGDEVGDRRDTVLRRRHDRRDVRDGDAAVAERLVHLPSERVHGRRLMIASDDGRPAAMGLKIGRDCLHPLRRVARERHARAGARHAQRARERSRKSQHLARLERQPMFRLRTRDRRNRLDDVEPVLLVLRGADLPA